MFANLTLYSKVWREESRNGFSEQELAEITNIEIVEGEYSISALVETNNGDMYIPIQRDSIALAVGDKLDPKQCILVHLKRGDQKTTKLYYAGNIL